MPDAGGSEGGSHAAAHVTRCAVAMPLGIAVANSVSDGLNLVFSQDPLKRGLEEEGLPDLRVGTVVCWQRLSPILARFRLTSESGSRFPDYRPGQYMALRREKCRLTRKVITPDGQAHYVTDVDETGKPRLGPVTHPYSIASAPHETKEHGYLEFYIVLETDELSKKGRLSGSLFEIRPGDDDTITYVNRIGGDFTLGKRATGFQSVFWVASGTGVAPFMSMIRQRHFDGLEGASDNTHYTLLYVNRTYEELTYHQELLEIEASGRFDFVYIPAVSRPSARDVTDPRLGRGRANNLLRDLLELPVREEQHLAEILARREDPREARAALETATAPWLPSRVSRGECVKRLDAAHAVIMACGNPTVMADIKYVADMRHIHFEKEDW